MYKLSRRQLTLSAGASLLLAPFASMLNEGTTRAAGTKQAKRLLVFCTMGTKPDSWKPTVSGETISSWSAMTQPLSAIKDSVVLVEGCPAGNPGDGHGSPEGLTGQGNGYYAVNNVQQLAISVDQFLADALKKNGINRPLSSLVLGVDTAGGVTLSYRGGKAVAPIGSPASAFSTAFGGISTGGSSTPTGGTPTTPDAALKRRQSILSLVSGEIKDLQGRLGSHEKAKLEAHLESINSLESKLMASSGSTGGGSNPNAAKACAGLSKPTDAAAPTDNALLHLDILVNALACDVTRVGVMQFGSDQSMHVNIKGANGAAGLQGEQHNEFIHSGTGDNFQKLIQFEAWQATQFANLVNSLKTKPDPDGGSGTLYDSTLVVWARDMGDAVNHDMKDMRFVLAGGAGGYLKQAAGGRYVNAGGGAGNRHERVLLNVLEAFGVTDYKGFGDPGFAGKAPLPGIAAT
ncbi:MAG TPA: DUF1552 domain-containing protein [Polyangiaceae bacterium]|nr:DUF1552 domain-containing protein [Polyangiaceae bacterium]